jgi:hypothetical protein
MLSPGPEDNKPQDTTPLPSRSRLPADAAPRSASQGRSLASSIVNGEAASMGDSNQTSSGPLSASALAINVTDWTPAQLQLLVQQQQQMMVRRMSCIYSLTPGLPLRPVRPTWCINSFCFPPRRFTSRSICSKASCLSTSYGRANSRRRRPCPTASLYRSCLGTRRSQRRTRPPGIGLLLGHSGLWFLVHVHVSLGEWEGAVTRVTRGFPRIELVAHGKLCRSQPTIEERLAKTTF